MRASRAVRMPSQRLAAGAGNTISGNTEGIALIGAGTTGDLVQGNFIGTDTSGSAAVGNSVFGVDVSQGAWGLSIKAARSNRQANSCSA